DVNPKEFFTSSLSVEKANKVLLGHSRTQVKLTLRREGRIKPFEIVVVRERAHEETVFGVRRRADAGWDHLLDSKQKIGYVRVANFATERPHDAAETSRELSQALTDLQRQG